MHRLYQRHGISQRPGAGEPKREKKFFKHYPIDYLHINISEIRTGEGKACLFVAVDRMPKPTHAQLYRKMTRQVAADFLETTLQALPYRAHTAIFRSLKID